MSTDVTTNLTRVINGDSSAVGELITIVYDELHRIAAACLAQERFGHTLQPTALVHEAYLKLVDQTRAQWRDRAHFLGIAATVIRRILVDYSRRRNADKRKAGKRLTLNLAEGIAAPTPKLDLLQLEECLSHLAELDERQARIIELRFFGGLTVEETAEVLGVSPRTVKNDWRFARAWLARELGRGANHE